jgi:hypothetical protein
MSAPSPALLSLDFSKLEERVMGLGPEAFRLEAVRYINAAPSPLERIRRKEEMYLYIYRARGPLIKGPGTGRVY